VRGVLGAGRMAARFVTQVQNLPGHRFVPCGSVREEIVDVVGAPIFALEAEHVGRHLDAREAPAMPLAVFPGT
jgi:predicted homoserine dehydrogenase-like protein